MKASLKWGASTLLIIALTSCGGEGGGSNGQSPDNDSLDTNTAQADPGGLMKVGGHLFSIPSPVQTALLIRKLGLPYEKGLPMPMDGAEKMATKAQQALGLGMYGADLAYVTVHRDGQRALNTLQSVQELSGKLDLQNAFDQELLDGFKKSLNNEDSLLRFTGLAFRSADRYLKQNNSDHISALVLAGGWIEGMYLSLSGPSDKLDAELINRLGEQRKTVENLIKLVESTDAEKTQGALIAGLKDVLAAYEGVSISYQYQAPTVDASHKTTYINSTSTVTMAPEKFKAIADKVKALRSTIIA